MSSSYIFSLLQLHPIFPQTWCMRQKHYGSSVQIQIMIGEMLKGTHILVHCKSNQMDFRSRMSITQVTTVQGSAPVPHKKKVLFDFQQGRAPSLWSFLRLNGLPLGLFASFSHPKHMKCRLIVDFQFPVGTDLSGCLSLPVSPAMNRWPLRGLVSSGSNDRLLIPDINPCMVSSSLHTTRLLLSTPISYGKIHPALVSTFNCFKFPSQGAVDHTKWLTAPKSF